jgi:uncharacterized protein
MHITLHLTSGCNLHCSYCYAPPRQRMDMADATARAAIEYAGRISPSNSGIIFFGGEPLLKKELIRSTIDYCSDLRKRYGWQHHFKVTTNGILLDEEFLEYCHSVQLSVGLSIDGVREANDYHRKSVAGVGSFDVLETKIDMLLRYQPYASFLMVITPETVKHYYDSVQYLFQKGARYIIASINYAGAWTDKDLQDLKKEYIRLAGLYEQMTIDQKKFYFSPFEVKFASHIRNEDGLCNKCHLGMRQISVSPDGIIYPCVQFVGKEEYQIGDVWHGMNQATRKKLYALSTNNSTCSECFIKERCNNRCSCLNFQTTGKINIVSPLVCETEKMLTPIVDTLGERLYKKKAPLFIQKHYNSVYPILSLLEDTN